MSNLSIAYIFQQQQLLVDQDFQLPQVERLHNDLALSSDHKVIARDLSENETIPEGFDFVPIRQLVQFWNKTQFEQASRAVQLLEWRRIISFVVDVELKPPRALSSLRWFVQVVATHNTQK